MSSRSVTLWYQYPLDFANTDTAIAIKLVCISQEYIVKVQMLHFERACRTKVQINLLPHMPILGSSSLAANKDMISKIWTNRVQLSD